MGRMSPSSSAETPIRVLIVDDEAPARMVLREYLGAIDGVEVVGECANGFEAVKAVGEQRPDLLFLDVQMPKLDGFEVLELLGDERPAVIFVTAYDEHALRAFEVHALDYLLKPFERERLVEAVERWRGRSGMQPSRAGVEPAGIEPAGVEQVVASRPRTDRVLVRDGDQIHVVPAQRLDYVEAQDDYVLLVAGEQRLRKQETLGKLESQLDPNDFVRIHRSYLLRIDRLARLERYAKDSRVAILRDGSRLPVSRSGYARLRDLL